MSVDELTSLTSPRNTNNKWAAWLITWNNHTEEDLLQLKQYVNDKCKEYRLQEERGEEGTPHIQGALYFKSRRTFSAIKKDLPKCHLEPSDNWNRIKNYCKKTNTRDGEIFEKGKVELDDPLEGNPLFPWQEEIITIMATKPNKRSIYWYWEPDGAVGKSVFSRHLVIKELATYVCGKRDDMKYIISEMLETVDIECLLIDIPKNVSEISYTFIEEVQNGMFCSGKYESKNLLFNVPHVIIFANWAPSYEKMSLDRWVVKNISETPLEKCETLSDELVVLD